MVGPREPRSVERLAAPGRMNTGGPGASREPDSDQSRRTEPWSNRSQAGGPGGLAAAGAVAQHRCNAAVAVAGSGSSREPLADTDGRAPTAACANVVQCSRHAASPAPGSGSAGGKSAGDGVAQWDIAAGAAALAATAPWTGTVHSTHCMHKIATRALVRIAKRLLAAVRGAGKHIGRSTRRIEGVAPGPWAGPTPLRLPDTLMGYTLAHMTPELQDKARKRVRRIAGQVGGIERMIEDDRYCVDILLQVAAVRAALDGVGKLLLKNHIETCVSDALASGRPKERRQKIDELLEVFSKFGHIGGR